ncbi:MAG: PfkB family carbohydrate kinase [Actinomycetota bacterium]|nr:PfkB family carbohydrate kinase [Actinomycetota bacterium]
MVVVGAINVDLVVAAPRLPGPGETVVGGGPERHGGGKGANAAVAAARAGASVHLVGAVGADDTGTSTLRELQDEGIDVTGLAVLPDRATGVALIVTAPDGENQIAVGAGANGGVTPEHVRRALDRALPTAGCVLVSTEIPGSAVAAAVEAATDAGVRCILNPAPVIPEVARLLDKGPLLTPNAAESDDLAGMLPDGGADATVVGEGTTPSTRAVRTAAAVRLTRRTSSPVVVTLGGDGALVVTPDGQVDHVPPRPTQVRDTTGAGDTFNGVLAARLAAGDALLAAVRVAGTAAALSVAHVGARGGMPTMAAIHAAQKPA